MIIIRLIIDDEKARLKRKSMTFEDDCQLIYHLESLIDYLTTIECEDSFDIMMLDPQYDNNDLKDKDYPSLDESKENVRHRMYLLGKHLAELKGQHSQFDLEHDASNN